MNWTRAIMTAAISIISAMLGAYFIWLGTEVNAIGKRIERIDVSVQGLIAERPKSAGPAR